MHAVLKCVHPLRRLEQGELRAPGTLHPRRHTLPSMGRYRGRHPTGHGECRCDGGPRHRSRPRQLRLRRRRAPWPSAGGASTAASSRPSPGCPRSAGWRPCTRASATCSTSTSPMPSRLKHCISVRTFAQLSRSDRHAASCCWPPASAGSAASTTPRSRSRARCAAPAAPTRARSRAWSRRCCRCRRSPRPDHAADALAVAICHANHAPFAAAAAVAG